MRRRTHAAVLIALAAACSEPVNSTGRIPPGPSSAGRRPIPLTVAALPISTGDICPGAQRTTASMSTRRSWRMLGDAFGVRPLYAQDREEVWDAKGNGDVHYRTLNGTYYDFQAVGEFVALRSESGDFEVQLRQQPYGTSKTISVATAVAMSVNGDRVGVYTLRKAPLYINGQAVPLTSASLPLPHGGRVEIQGNQFVGIWPNGSQARVVYGHYVDVIVTLCPPHRDPVNGLLGRGNDVKAVLTSNGGSPLQFDGTAADRYEQLYHRFGDSWRVRQRKSLFDYDPGENTATFTDLKFPYPPDSASPRIAQSDAEGVCRNAGIAQDIELRNCVLDVSATGETAFADNDAFVEALFVKSHRAQAGVGSFHCGGPAGRPGWTCQVGNLAGAKIGSMMTLSLETKTGSATRIERLACGPIAPDYSAACADSTRGVNFEGAQVVERYTLKSGEAWEIKSRASCEPRKSSGDAC